MILKLNVYVEINGSINDPELIKRVLEENLTNFLTEEKDLVKQGILDSDRGWAFSQSGFLKRVHGVGNRLEFLTQQEVLEKLRLGGR